VNWEAIGALAEVFGAVAVIATLAYLAVQIRQNNRLIEASLAESHVSAANELPRIIASDADAADIFWRGLDTPRKDLPVEDVRRFDPMIFLYTISAYQAFRQDGEEGLARSYWILKFVGFQDWWSEYRNTYPEDFQKTLENKISRH
jgi:hypothetical protein